MKKAWMLILLTPGCSYHKVSINTKVSTIPVQVEIKFEIEKERLAKLLPPVIHDIKN